MGPAPQRPAPQGSSPARQSDPRIGVVVGDKYRIVRKLGSGGMGSVYEAEHTVVGRRFAIKFLHEQFSDRRSMVQRFLREAKAAGSLRSDHVIGACDYGEEAGGPYLVMDLHRGCDLREILRRRPRLTLQQSLRIAIDVCRGLQVAHDAGLVHRDLKPANIFVARRCSGETSAKVLDFGVAKLRDAQELSDEGTLVGTLGYMAPEQLMGSTSLDGRADLHALGVILYQMLSGRPPYRGERAALVREILAGNAVRLETLEPNLPQGLCQVVHSLLSTAPNARPESARALMDALSPYLSESRQREETHDDTPAAPLEQASTVFQSQPVPSTLPAPRVDLSRSAIVLSVGALALSLVAMTTMFAFVYSQGRVAILPSSGGQQSAPHQPELTQLALNPASESKRAQLASNASANDTARFVPSSEAEDRASIPQPVSTRLASTSSQGL